MSGGFITIRNSGGYVAKFTVEYTEGGHRVTKDSGKFTVGTNESVPIPEGATDIFLKVEEYVFFGSTSTVFTERFSGPVKKYYKIWGTTLAPNHCETDSHFDCRHAKAMASLAVGGEPAGASLQMVRDEAAPVALQAAASPATTLDAAEFAAAGGHGLNGCIGLFAGLSLCYDLSVSPPSAHICLEFAGIELACLDLSTAKPCAHLKGDYKLVSWDLELCLDVPGKRVTLSGKVCTLGMCKKFNITVVSW